MIKELLARGIAHAADSKQGFIQLARNLTAIAETAYTRRDLHTLKEASDLLIALPVPRAQNVGIWYLSTVQRWERQFTEAAGNLEKLLADPDGAPGLRARAFQALGAIQHVSGSFDLARQLYIESARYIRRESPRDAVIFADSVILHSLLLSNEGDSRQALRELLSIQNIIEVTSNPLLQPTYYNNIAVELLQLGKVSEARHYSQVACQSPLAFAYPEWKETALEIEQRTAKREAVAVAVLPEPEHQKRPAQPKYLLIVLRFSPPARVIRPVAFRQRVTCSNPTVALVALVARIRAPSF
jgi:hypothetical protein